MHFYRSIAIVKILLLAGGTVTMITVDLVQKSGCVKYSGDLQGKINVVVSL